MTVRSEPLFLFGPGYSATALSELWEGPIYGTVRPDSSRTALERTRITPIDIGEAATIFEKLEGPHLPLSSPSGPSGYPALHMRGQLA